MTLFVYLQYIQCREIFTLRSEMFHTETCFNLRPDTVTHTILCFEPFSQVLHTGDMGFATDLFDHLVASHSSIDLIGTSTGLVENGECLVDWPEGTYSSH